MGIDYNVYIGPYIRCVNTKVDTLTEETRCPKCKFSISTPFCPRCGSEKEVCSKSVSDWAVDEEVLYDTFQAVGREYHEELASLYFEESELGVDYYTLNKRDGPGISFSPKYEFGIIANEVDSDKDKAQLSEMCSESLALLRKMYGDDKVFVEWGVISYTS